MEVEEDHHEGPKIVLKAAPPKEHVSEIPVPKEAAAPGAKVVEEKTETVTKEDAEKAPVEESKAPGEEEAEAKP